VNASSEAVDGRDVERSAFDFNEAFRIHYAAIARVIARVVHDPARAEELAVEVFLQLWRTPRAQTGEFTAWLYRVAVRRGLDELRRRKRRERYERIARVLLPVPNPEEIRTSAEEKEGIRRALASIRPREAALLLLRSDDLSYEQIAAVLELNPASVGKLLSRAQEAFRKEYVKRYGQLGQ
jgi:RNA polymerase sigma-70 factor (ECF subfamily)